MEKIFQKTMFWICLMPFLFLSIYGQDKEVVKLKQVTIQGNHAFQTSPLLKEMDLVLDKSLPNSWPDTSLEKLLGFYHNQGFYFCRVDSFQTQISQDSVWVHLTIWMTEGGLLEVGFLQIRENGQLTQLSVLDDFFTQSGKSFLPKLFEEDINLLLTHLENTGNPLARVEVDSFQVVQSKKKNEVNISLKLNSGPLVTIGSLAVQGNKLTKEGVILRETQLQVGDIFQKNKIVEAGATLQRLGFFDKVDEPQIVFQGDKAEITFKVQEGNANTMDGVVGYNPPKDKRGKGYVTGRLEFTFRNLFGTGRFLEAYWEKKDRYSQAMKLAYEEPWFLGWPVHLGGMFQQEVRDTTYLERETHFSIRYTPWRTLSLQIKAGATEVLPDSLGTVLYELPQSRALFLSGVLDYNTLDDPVNPRHGLRYQTTVTFGRKRNSRTEYLPPETIFKKRVHTRKIHVMLEMALPLFHHQVGYLKVNGHEVRTGDKVLPISEQIRFGGSRTLRGYKEDAFRGALAAWSTLEYRYLIGRSSRAFLFLDSGLYQRKEGDGRKIRRFKMGYGFGIRLKTRLGLMGVDYGLGEGDRLMQGKIHVGLMNQF